MTELGAAEHRVVGVDQVLVAAAVDLEVFVSPDAAFGLQVGVDVGAAEGVDGLFRVADQDERDPAAREGALQDLPLDRVGVLELVDQHDPVAPLEPLDRLRTALARQLVPQPRQQVVVGDDRRRALAPVQLGPDAARQPRAQRREAAAGASRGSIGEPGLPTTSRAICIASARVISGSPESMYLRT